MKTTKQLKAEYIQAKNEEYQAQKKADKAFLKFIAKVGQVHFRRSYNGRTFVGEVLDTNTNGRSVLVRNTTTDAKYWVHESWLELNSK